MESTDDYDLDKFLSLLVSVPIESTKYAFIGMFLKRILNLKDESVILDANAYERKPDSSRKKRKPVEILPQIAVPPKLWLQHDIVVKNMKIKSSLLKEINSMLLEHVELLRSNAMFLIDETSLSYYEKILVAYNFLEFGRNHNRFDPLREDDEFEDDDGSSMLSLTRARSLFFPDLNNAPFNPASYSRPPSIGSHKSVNRISTLSRDFLSSKRKQSILGHLAPALQNSDDERRRLVSQTSMNGQLKSQPNLNSSGQFQDEKLKDHSITNSILSKSKIYNRIKKRRELYSLVSSALSTPISVTSVNSSPSFRRTSGVYDGEGRSHHLYSPLSASQRIENQKDKHEYYVQVRRLAENTNALVGHLGQPGSRAMFIRLMEFIKNSVFKFIIIDVSLMIIEFGHLKASEVEMV